MTPEQIIDKLKLNGAKISRKTLYNWEKAEVISPASFRNSRTAEYPAITFNEVYAAYIFTQQGMNVPLFGFRVKVALDAVINIRKVYGKISDKGSEMELHPWNDKKDLEKIICTLLSFNSNMLTAFQTLDLGIDIYWPTQYHFYLQKAYTLL